MNQAAPGDRRRKQKRHLGLGERQRGAFMWNHPRQHHDDEEHERAAQFKKLPMLR